MQVWHVAQLICNQLGLFSWKDPLEIVIFSSCIYWVATWLKKDRNSTLLVTFFAYCFCLILLSFFSLNTVTSFLWFYGPGLFMIGILVHQESLQKNFVTFKNATTQLNKTASNEWIELIVRACLHARSHNKSLLCIIEQRDSLKFLIDCPITLNAPVDLSLLTVLIESPSYNQTGTLYITKDGTLHGIHCTIKGTFPNNFVESAQKLTHKTDALVLILNPTQAGFSFIVNGSLIEQITAKQLLTLIKQQLVNAHKTTPTQGDHYEVKPDQTNTHEQLHS